MEQNPSQEPMNLIQPECLIDSSSKDMSHSKSGTRDAKCRYPINYDKINEFEKLAQSEKNGYFGIYHVSLDQPDAIYESFHNFTARLIEE